MHFLSELLPGPSLWLLTSIGKYKQSREWLTRCFFKVLSFPSLSKISVSPRFSWYLVLHAESLCSASHVYPGIATVVPLLSSKIFLELSTSFTIMTQGLLTTEALPVPLKTSSEREIPLTLVSQSLHHSPELLALRCPHILQHCIHTLAQAELWCGCWSMKAHVLRTTFKRRSWGWRDPQAGSGSGADKWVWT